MQEIGKSADDGKQRMNLASQMGWVVSCLYTRIEILACIKIHLRAGRAGAIDFGSKSHREGYCRLELPRAYIIWCQKIDGPALVN